MPKNDEIDYFFASLDFHLKNGEMAGEALMKAVEDYRFVFIIDDGRLPIARAAEVSLAHLKTMRNDS